MSLVVLGRAPAARPGPPLFYPMPENHLINAAIRYGLDGVSVRAMLREMNDELIAEGPGASLGVHGLGVFYTQRNKERFVTRDGDVFKVPQRDVVKLRPRKSSPTKLTESDEVKLDIPFNLPSSNTIWQWKSTSRANRFEVIIPTAHAGDDYDFCRVSDGNQDAYVLVKQGESDATAQAISGPLWDFTNDIPRAIWFSRRGLLDVLSYADNAQQVTYVTQTWFANVNGASRFIWDATYGAEVKAWVAQRAIAIADR